MTPWTEQEDAILTELRGKGFSATLMKKHLPGRSRNAILGRVHRLGLPPRKIEPKHKKKRSEGKRRIREKPMLFTAPIVEIAPSTPEPVSLDLELDQLTERTCKWPFGDGPFTFCGCEKEPDAGPYCAYHKQKATAKPDTRRKAKRSLWGFNQARQPDFYQIMAEAAE